MELYQNTYQIGSNDYFDGNVYTTMEEAIKACDDLNMFVRYDEYGEKLLKEMEEKMDSENLVCEKIGENTFNCGIYGISVL